MNKIFNGQRLKEARLYNKLTITELGVKLNVTKQMISKYENQNIEPSFEKSLQLTTILGYPREFFYTIDKFNIQNEGTFFRSRLTATQKAKNPASIALKYSVIMRDFLEQYIDFPQLEERENYELLQDYNLIAKKMRNFVGLDNGPIPDIIEVAELMGFTVISMNYNESKVDAFSSMNVIENAVGDINPYFVIATGTGESRSFYRQQFSIAHEMAHWVLHQNINPQELDKEEYKVMEDEANKLASIFLLPEDTFGAELATRVTDEIDTFYSLKRKWNVSMAAMIKRARDLSLINGDQEIKLYKQMHYRKWKNPEPFDLETKTTVPVAFKQSLELLIDEGILKGHEIPIKIAEQYNLYLTPKMLAMICGVEPALFIDNSESRVVLKLKDFKRKHSS
ncbi:XRE family transcriptional regulator [Sporosarcina limicola]|uniref:Zn-dependent peptidase ImmA (M78 family)/DNA-binding XRE family transcriptional regulator n=1 Tax=Sporosarcina limicola TaxID=34101 RepID=A0A927MTP2_9BACL|nr:XRE family transcriptional regulator [Sporosarcina limicola]MBE1557199.1 Zn-dependent peptidase ImmA (M78 family)/DNA-binding XRE family transcriptional regulator [Sporosarcina limicola]